MNLLPPTFRSGTRGLEGNLWGISGYFSSSMASESVAFGGYLFLDSFWGEKILYGQLIDSVGQSTVKSGEISEVSLSFDKKYDKSNHGEDDFVHYEFQKEGDLWVGKFKRQALEGIAKCKIFPLFE